MSENHEWTVAGPLRVEGDVYVIEVCGECEAWKRRPLYEEEEVTEADV